MPCTWCSLLSLRLSLSLSLRLSLSLSLSLRLSLSLSISLSLSPSLSPSLSLSVAIAVSGGSDSIALTHLARQAFSRVVGVTVDHQLREESQREALRVGELVTKMGVEHRILTLDWGGEGEGGRGDKVQESARAKRYSALFGLCEQLGINVLMTGHHLNDQLGRREMLLSKAFLPIFLPPPLSLPPTHPSRDLPLSTIQRKWCRWLGLHAAV